MTTFDSLEDMVDWVDGYLNKNCQCEDCSCKTPQQEYSINLTQKEIQTVDTLLAFVGGNQTIYNVRNKFNPYVDQEELEEAFGDVELEIDNDLPLFSRNIPMQENYMTIKINK